MRSKAASFETELLAEPAERDRGLILDRGEDAHVVGARRAGEHTRARGDCESVHRCPQRAVDERAPAADELHDGDVAAAFVLVGESPRRLVVPRVAAGRHGPARQEVGDARHLRLPLHEQQSAPGQCVGDPPPARRS